MIVKVQWPITGEPVVLIYNRDRSIQQALPITDGLRRAMFGRKPPTLGTAKQYFYARISKNNNLILLNRAANQRW